MSNTRKDYLRMLNRLADEMPGLKFEQGKKHITVTREGHVGKVNVASTPSTKPNMLNALTRIRRKFQ